MVIWLVLVVVAGLISLSLVLNANTGIDNDPFYMGDRDDLFIDYCNVCGKRHDFPHCVRCRDCAEVFTPIEVCSTCGRCYDCCKCTPWEGE
jgi:hypothetical protein